MISCNQHDYIEIACLYHLPLRLVMKNGKTMNGVAKDTVRDQNKRECILIDQGEDQLMVVLEELQTMQVTIDNPHFDIVQFTE